MLIAKMAACAAILCGASCRKSEILSPPLSPTKRSVNDLVHNPRSAVTSLLRFTLTKSERRFPPRVLLCWRQLRIGAWSIAITIVFLSGTFAFADDKSECLDGIKAIKAAVAKNPPKPVLDRLKRALADAEQEEFEGDWDECVAAVRQAQLPKK